VRFVRILAFVETLRASFWIVPGAAVLAALAAGVLLPHVHVASDGRWASYVFTGGADGARSVLAAIATSIITVTSLTFSLTVVTLQLASSQFSPRLLRTFLRDLRNQTVLATLLATFLYSLTVLRVIRSGNGSSDEDVPKLAISVSYLLVIASVLALVWFLHHVVSLIRVDTLIAGVRDETLRVAGRTDAARQDDEKWAAVDVPMPALPRDAAPVLSRQSGFLLAVDTDALEAWARAENVVVAVDARPGTWMLRGTPWARVSIAGDSTPDDAASALLSRIAVGNERTSQQDVEFGLRQLVDVAARALSPGVNDPTTAVHCVNHLADVLVVLAHTTLGCEVRRDGDGSVRVAVAGATFDNYLELACGQVRRYGAGEPAVVSALLSMLGGVGAQLSEGWRRQAVRAQLDAIVTDAHTAIQSAHDAAIVRERADRVAAALK
jgi:uncharacterized membrane protein